MAIERRAAPCTPRRTPSARRLRPRLPRFPCVAPRDGREPDEGGAERPARGRVEGTRPEPEAEHRTSTGEARGLPPGAGKATTARRVLVVDDERAIRFLCRVNLSGAGMEALEAQDGDEALQIAAAERPDLVLLDVMMPGRDGWEVARELARRPDTRHIPVVFLTARGDDADRRLGQKLGSVGYVVKPFDPITLPAWIEGVLRRLEHGEREQLNREILPED